MKKLFIASGLIILIALAAVLTLMFMNSSPSEIIGDEETSDETKTDYEQISTDINVDGLLRISGITGYNGKLAIIAENISDTDIEYMLLTAKNGNQTYTFNASVLMKNTEIMLICNENVNSDFDATQMIWETENVINFSTPPSMNPDVFEISVLDGSISVKNISDKNIDTDVFLYYKEKINGFPDGSITHKIRIAGLATSAVTYIKTPGINEKNCEIVFTQY